MDDLKTRKNYATSAAKASIPRGYRKEYIPISDQLYKQFLESGDTEIGDKLLHSLDAARQAKWMETVEQLDSARSCRKKHGLCCESWVVEVKLA